MATTKIIIQRKNPYTKILQCYDTSVSPKVAYDLTGKTIFFTIKSFDDNADTDDDALLKKDISSHTTPTAGTSLLDLAAADTTLPVGDYKADFRIYQVSPLIQLNSIQVLCEIRDIVTKRTA